MGGRGTGQNVPDLDTLLVVGGEPRSSLRDTGEWAKKPSINKDERCKISDALGH